MKIVIVGAGIMGLATAWALKRRGHSVTVFEQGMVPNPLGGSVDRHRIIRHAYGADAGYTAMIDPAFAAWERLWADLGERLYVETGVLAIARDPAGWAETSKKTMLATGVALQGFSGAETTVRFPLLLGAGIASAHQTATGGVLLADRIVAALARELGDTVKSGEAVRAVDPDRGQVTLATGANVSADQVVVAAGPWVGRLLPRIGPRVTPSRQVVVYAEPPAHLAVAWRAMPVVLDLDLTSGFYLIPPVAGFPLKLGDHRFTLRGDPDRDRDATAADIAAILAVCRARLREFDRFALGEARTCFYDVEPKERFIVEPVGKHGWAMSGFSGHGFKVGALLGETLAAAITGERDPAAVARYAAGLGGP